MEAGIDLGFTALIAAAVSGGQHRDRLADRKRKSTATSPYCFKNISHPTSQRQRRGIRGLMEAGIDLGFTALMGASVSGGQHRDRASRPQKELYCDIVGLLLKTGYTTTGRPERFFKKLEQTHARNLLKDAVEHVLLANPKPCVKRLLNTCLLKNI
jgi:hypothetical protein